MNCCGRCKICRSEWEEIERKRDLAQSRADTLAGLLREALPYVDSARPDEAYNAELVARIVAALSDGDGERGGGS